MRQIFYRPVGAHNYEKTEATNEPLGEKIARARLRPSPWEGQLSKSRTRARTSWFLQAYPQLSKADLIAVWEYAARAATEEVVLVES